MFNRARRLSLLLLMPVLSLVPAPASAWTLKIIYSFCAHSGCSDGNVPEGSLLPDGAGGFFGTTQLGGNSVGVGTVYQIVPNADRSKWREKVLYRFCRRKNCADGSVPSKDLISDTAGNLYGITSYGGKQDAGTVFELLAPTAERPNWSLQTLHSFCGNACKIAEYDASSGLTYLGKSSDIPYDGVSPLYGVTNQGGKFAGGVVYRLAPPRPGKIRWEEHVIYNFCSSTNCSDGAYPAADLIDAAGNLYGTTGGGGRTRHGTVFELQPGSTGKWTEVVLHSFCARQNCLDGDLPFTPVIMSASGDLFGNTNLGGTYNSGIVFKLAPDGAQSRFKVLHSFGNYDGNYPFAGLTIASRNLLGTTYQGGGAQDAGTVFEVTRQGALTVLHTFCSLPNCADGANAVASVVVDSSSNIFGTTVYGGAFNSGTVFEVIP